MSAGPERTPPRRALAGRVLGGRYRVTRMVSAGANTLIADAEDLEVERAVTVKLVRPEWAESAEFRRRFAAAMRTMSKLSHPNIAAVHDWGEEEIGKRTTVYAVVEHLAGGSLRDLFDRGRHLDPSQALVVGLEACRGLDFAHRSRLVHTELTPSKLVFGDDRRLRIVDFGLARLLGAHDWREPATVPTHVARYCSPEQALAQPIDAKTDVYSLALILVEAVTGAVPFAARSTVATLSARIGRLMPVSADLGPLASVLERAGRPDPAERSTAAELGRNLVRAAEKLPRPKPIPIVVTSPFDEDPARMRRPNDPTGGITRPDDPPAVAPTPTAPAAGAVDEPPVEREEDAAPGDVAPTPEERAAEDSLRTATEPTPAGPTPTGPTPTERAPTGPAAPPPEPAGPTASATPPPAGATGGLATAAIVAAPAAGAATLYDDETDRQVDEPAAPAVATPSDTGGPGAVDVPSVAAADVEPPPARPTMADPGLHPPAPAPAATAVQVEDVPPAVAAAQEERRRRRWIPWLVALGVVGALAALSYLAVRLFEVPTHPVPDLVGDDEDAARAQTADFDWDVDVQYERSDDQPTPGAVIRTAPAAGTELAEGEPFLVVVSEGPEFRSLPELAGLTLGEAETALAERRLVALPATEQYDEEVPAGSVISWSVPAEPGLAAGGQVLPDAEVAMVVSLGPAPRTVPALAGITVEAATAELERLRLVPELAEAVFSDDVPSGSVVSAQPAAGTEVERGTTVTMVPSKGVDLVTVPDLSGLTLPASRDALGAAGLRVGSLLGNSQGLFVSASVGGEAVAPGDRLRRGTAVNLVFL